MLKNLPRVIAAELALHKHNKVNRQGVVSADAQTYHVIENVLPAQVYQGLLTAVDELHSTAVRENSHWRKGQAVGGHELMQGAAAPWLDHFSRQPFIEKLRTATGIKTLSLVPEEDTNRLSLLFYDEPQAADESGDGTDWHMDGSIYLGARWAGILTLVENTHDLTSKLELQPHGALTQISKTNLNNSLILFQGDHVLHRVRSLASGERRVVMSLLFSDWPVRTRNPWLRRYQANVNLAFYGSSQA
ncbi:MAG: hypothetical protein GWP70_04790 [Proteobacteria bacterium]|nr:hypothetical protein [Pseudomonadota bacterium]